MKGSLCKIICIFMLLVSQAKALTYEQALDLAVGYDKKYASAILEQKSTEYLPTVARAALLSKITLSGFQAANRLNTNQADIYGNPSTTNLNYVSQTYSAQLTQPLINLASIAGYIQSNKQEEAAIAKLAIAFNELSLQVANAYSNLGAAKEALLYTKKELKVLEDQEKIMLAKKNNGVSSQSDVQEVIYSKLQVQSNLDEVNNNLAQAIITLEKITGIKISEHEPIAFVNSAKLANKSLEELIYYAKDVNPRVVYQKKQYETAIYENKKIKSAYAPTVDIVAAQQFQNSGTLSTINQKSLQTYAGLQLNIPIFEGGGTYGKDMQSAIYAESQKVLIESELNDVQEVIQKDYEQMKISAEKFKTLTAQIESAKYLYGSIELQKELGLKSTFDLLVSIRRLFQSQRDASRAKFDGALAAKRLEINSGISSY